MLPFAIAIFLSAFLLFQIQPVLGKFILPWFGGTPAVWSTCLVFFQVMLLGGYGYAHLLVTKLKPRSQALVHCSLLFVTLAFLPVTPALHWKPSGGENPAWRIVCLLTATVGVPYLLLSASGPLLQAWFAGANPGKSPYRLYALSNAGSLLALFSYPFLVEPSLSLNWQTQAWSGGFVLLALIFGLCARHMLSASAMEISAPVEAIQASEIPKRYTQLAWLVLSALSSVLLVATTNQLLQDVAVVPFLWVLPLGLYLLSFIICFDRPLWYWRPFWSFAVFLSFTGAYVAVQAGVLLPLKFQIAAYCAALFSGCMICHGELVKSKPAPAQLTRFYLLISAGGAMGGVAVAVVAPLIFLGYWEYHAALLGCAALSMLLMYQATLSAYAPRWGWVPLLVVFTGLSGSVVSHILSDINDSVVVTRNFFGVLRVVRQDEKRFDCTSLVFMHGRITHGLQFEKAELRRSPVSYYGPRSGIGAAMSVLQERYENRPMRMGVVGLGAGLMAVYGRAGDTMRFYEINPDVVRISNAQFSYCRDSGARIEIVVADARIALEREHASAADQKFDLLVLDAFTGGAIPLHLLTREAFELYWQHMNADAILAIHVSNKFLNLGPLVRGIAAADSKHAVLVSCVEKRHSLYESSTWILICGSAGILDAEAIKKVVEPWPVDAAKLLVLSDQDINLFRLMAK